MSMTSTNRRSFLKAGALVATPIAALAPVAALADDGTRSRLAQMEDEKAIEALTRSFLRRFNGSDAGNCGEFVASSGAIQLDADLCAIAEDPAEVALIELADNGTSATYRRACVVDRTTQFTGNTTMEKMARFQGQGSARHSEKAMLDAQFSRTAKGWTITSLRLA